MNTKLSMHSTIAPVIPKQKLSPWIRWPLRLLAYPFMMLEITAQKFVRTIIRPRYKLKGGCKKRGACCKYIHMGWPKKGKLTLFSKIYIFWQTEVLGFYFKGFDFVEEGEVIKVMGCRYLKEDGSCMHYKLRPALCRNWPRIYFFKEPTLLKGCGYQAVKREISPLIKRWEKFVERL